MVISRKNVTSFKNGSLFPKKSIYEFKAEKSITKLHTEIREAQADAAEDTKLSAIDGAIKLLIIFFCGSFFFVKIQIIKEAVIWLTNKTTPIF